MEDSPEASWNIYFHSSEQMHELRDGVGRIAIASPPFTNNPDGKTLDKQEYIDFIDRVSREIHRVLEPGGILVTVNTDLRDHARYNQGNSRFDGLLWQKHSTIRQILDGVGFQCIDTKIWAKSLKRNQYRYAFSYIQIFRKPGNKAGYSGRQPVAEGFGPDVWLLEGGTYRRDENGFVFRDAIHPEIVKRCVEQFTSPGDLVVSPFTGSGTVVAVSRLLGRLCIGYEINRDLEPLIRTSVESPYHMRVYKAIIST